MLQLRQFNLQFTLVRTCPLSKNIKNQAGTIQYPAFKGFFEIAFLAGREVVIKNNQPGTSIFDNARQFIQLTGAYKKFGVRRYPLTCHQHNRVSTC